MLRNTDKEINMKDFEANCFGIDSFDVSSEVYENYDKIFAMEERIAKQIKRKVMATGLYAIVG